MNSPRTALNIQIVKNKQPVMCSTPDATQIMQVARAKPQQPYNIINIIAIVFMIML